MRFTIHEAPPKIAAHEPFTGSTKAFRGEAREPSTLGPWGAGQLPRQYAQHPSLARATYIVWSYSTPIAWFADGTWYEPPVKYSITTTKHQSSTSYGIHLSGEPVDRSLAEDAPAKVPSSTGGAWSA